MDISQFLDRLRGELAERGIPAADIDTYIADLTSRLSAAYILSAGEKEIGESVTFCLKAHSAKMRAERSSASRHGDPPADKIRESAERGKSTRAVAMLILVTAVTSPLWLICGCVFFAPFLLMFALEAAVTALLICLLAGAVAAGTATSLTGIVYGIVKLFSVPAVGVYEIGFGIIIVGITVICGILIYNGAVRLMPWLFRGSFKLLRKALSRVMPLLGEYRRRCEGL